MTDPCESIRPHCQLCHQLIHDVAYLTFGARTPATPLHQEEPAIWELFITWVGCGDCTELLQECCRNEVLLRTYHLRKLEEPWIFGHLTITAISFLIFLSLRAVVTCVLLGKNG